MISAETYGDQRWFVSRRFDLMIVLAGGLLLSLGLFLSFKIGAAFLAIAVMFAIVADFPHVLQTYSRLLLDREEYAVYRREFWISLTAIGSIIAYLIAAGEKRTLLMVWVYWQIFHVVKQHDGVVALYAAKQGYGAARQLAKATLFLGCAAPVFYRMANGGFRFGAYSVNGMDLPLSNMSVPVPPVSFSIVALVYAVFALVGTAFIVQQVRLARTGGALPFASFATLVSAIACYNLAYILVEDLWATILIATAVHSLQYHTLCWVRSYAKYGRRPLEECRGATRILAWSTRRRHVAWYALGLVGLGAVCAYLEPLVYGVPLTIVLHHFYLDGSIWKGQRNPSLARDLGLPRRAAKVPA